MENRFKTFFRKEISSVNPEAYAERFIAFIEKFFQWTDDNYCILTINILINT